MANKTNSTSNFFETLVDNSQKAFDTMVETTKKFSNGNPIVNETIEKSTEFFKKAVDATKENVDKANAQSSTIQQEFKKTTDQATNFFTNWKDQQTAWAKQMQDMNTQFLQQAMNPSSWQQNMNNMQQMFNGMNTSFDMNQFTNMMNPANMQSQFDKATEQVKSFWNQFQGLLTNNYNDLTTKFQNGTLADTYKGMFNMSEGFSKFYELWMPMMKSMQDKTFNMDTFSKNLDMNKYKEFMDKYFSFMPQATQEYVTKMKDMYTEAMKQGTAQSTDFMNSMKSSMNQMMPGMFGNPFQNMLSQYNSLYSQMGNAVTPFAKLMTPNADTKNLQAWTKIINDMNVYNIKNSELQFMIYQTGMKVMEKMAASAVHKIENGEEVNSMMKMYQEYLNTSDKVYVDLFETDEYSKLMAEVSAMKLSIKKAIELETEKMFVNVPLATRSEMDEVYQTIYDLKKQVRELQAALKTTPVAKAETKSTPAKAKTVVKTPVAKKAAKVVAKKTTKRK